MESVIIGIDLGGTNLRIGAVTPDNEMIAPSVIKSAIVANADKPLEKICEIIENYMEKNNIRKVDAISIGVPSSVENDKETVICTTNIRNQAGEVVFSHINMAKDIKEYFKVPVYINNDVNNIMLYDIVSNRLEGRNLHWNRCGSVSNDRWQTLRRKKRRRTGFGAYPLLRRQYTVQLR